MHAAVGLSPPALSFVLAAALMTASPVSARIGYPVNISNLSTADLASDCAKTERIPLGQTFCFGYVLGVLDVMISDGDACTDTNFRISQGLAVARKYLRDHPEEWNQHPMSVLTTAFKAAFPCRR